MSSSSNILKTERSCEIENEYRHVARNTVTRQEIPSRHFGVNVFLRNTVTLEKILSRAVVLDVFGQSKNTVTVSKNTVIEKNAHDQFSHHNC